MAKTYRISIPAQVFIDVECETENEVPSGLVKILDRLMGPHEGIILGDVQPVDAEDSGVVVYPDFPSRDGQALSDFTLDDISIEDVRHD